MLVTNQRLDKLAAARTDFGQREMLNGSLLSSIITLMNTPSTQPPANNMEDSNADTAGTGEGRTQTALPESNDNDADIVEGPRVMADVVLARTYSMFH